MRLRLYQMQISAVTQNKDVMLSTSSLEAQDGVSSSNDCQQSTCTTKLESKRRVYQAFGVTFISDQNTTSLKDDHLHVGDAVQQESTISITAAFWTRALEVKFFGPRSFIPRSIVQYDILPRDSDIFSQCQSGNITSIQQTFGRRSLSPFVMDPHGKTPLHYAAYSDDPRTCQFLIDQGVDPDRMEFRAGLRLPPSGLAAKRRKRRIVRDYILLKPSYLHRETSQRMTVSRCGSGYKDPRL